MFKNTIVAMFLGLGFFTYNAYAEEFLGIESNDRNVEQNASNPAETAKPEASYSESTEPDIANSDQVVSRKSSSSYRKWNMMISGGSPGKDRVGADASVSMKTSAWTSWRLTGNYIRYKSANELELAYGGALYYALRYENKTMIKPSAGAGPGYQKWKRESHQILFNDNASATLNGFWGVALMFTDHFGLNIQRNWKMYLEEGPVLFEDFEKSENKTAINTSIGFLAYF